MAGNDSRQTPSDEIPSLNGIRAISVLIVLLSHAGFERYVPGGLGVTIFFFLSGYLITTLLLRERARSGATDIYAFYVRRFFRLMPPLIVMLIIAYALTAAGILPGNITIQGIASQLFYFANYLEIFFDGSLKIPTGTGVLWSLSVEEHFYLAFPLLMAFAFAAGMSNTKKALIAATVCLLVLLWRCYLVYGFAVPESRTYFASDTRIDSIAYGCILAFLLWRPREVASDPRRLTSGEYAMLAGAGALMMFTLAYRDPQFRETFRYSLQGLALMPIFVLAVRRHESWPFRLLNSRLAVTLGIYSYSIYLIHRVVIVALVDNVPQLVEQPVLLVVITLAASVAFAALVDHYVDSYFKLKRTKILKRRDAVTSLGKRATA